MKLKLRSLLLVLAGTAIIYSGCKKTAKTTADPQLAPQDVASQVALNIDQSLFGGLGVDISGGLNSPGDFAVHTKGKVQQSLANPDCSLLIDTTMSFTGAANGGSATIAGTFKFSFSCANNVVSGFNTNDNLSVTLTSPSLNLNYKVAENLTLLSADPLNPDANLSLNGSLNSNGSYQYNTGTKRSGTEVFDYTLTSVIFSPAAADIVSGTATFNTSGSGPKGVWNYQGTITFLGNHMAKVVINGKSYTVNLQTGAVS
ncbi:MAG TPA: hypothetical protein VNX40_11635 [Mucilaginibacter sp.]|jgi:hypothetical protein|nr:hypothetical protein [Mucilaginibacter sp.]